jgi:hypothetical protein
MTEFGQCKLCGDSEQLVDSNIIPGFVAKLQKEHSHIDHLTYSSDDGRSGLQDFPKAKLLCESCEGRLDQKGESPFSAKLFREFATTAFAPKLDGGERPPESVEYGSWLRYFAVSLAWRVLLEDLHLEKRTLQKRKHRQELRSAFEVWRNFLLEDGNDLKGREVYIYPLFPCQKEIHSNTSPYLNRYFARVTDSGVEKRHGVLFTYIKLPSFTFIGQISPAGAEILPIDSIECSGTLSLRGWAEYPVAPEIWCLWNERAEATVDEREMLDEDEKRSLKHKFRRLARDGRIDELQRAPELSGTLQDLEATEDLEALLREN